jgi:biopolymer transport protein ExbD
VPASRIHPLRLFQLQRWSLVWAALAVGCSPGCANPTPTAAIDPVASVPAAATAPAGGDKAQALVRCAAAGERAQAKLPAAPDEAFAEMTAGCAYLYSAPACREAFLNAGKAPPESRLSGIIDACRGAYCPRLAEPKPDLCLDPRTTTALDQLTQWRAFTRRVFALELGVSEDELPRSLGMPFGATPSIPLETPRPQAGAQAAPARLELALDPQGRPIVSIDRNGHASSYALPPDPTPQDFAAVARAASEQAGPGGSVVIRADRRVPHGAVIALLDALKANGVTRIAFGVSPP